MLRRLKYLLNRRVKEADLDEEIQAHLAIERQRQIDAGEAPENARNAALRDFGNTLHAKESIRDVWGWTWLDQLSQDLRYGCRMLAKHPGFSLAAVLSLALGIGATTAVFGVFDAVVLRPMPVLEPGRLVRLVPQIKDKQWILVNPIFEKLRDRQQSLSGLFAVSDAPYLQINIEGTAVRGYVRGSIVSGAYFRTLGLTPVAGRFLTEDDDQVPGANNTECAAVVSQSWWARHGLSDPLGRKIRVRTTDCTIVGVAPAEFGSHQPGYVSDIWVPMRQLMPLRSLQNHYGAFYSGVLGRLKPGIGGWQAQAELTALYQQIQAEEPKPPAGIPDKPIAPESVNFRLAPGGHGLEAVQRLFERPLQLILMVVATVLLIAGANVAGLVLARGAARSAEFATRAAIGAGRGRLTRQLLAEGCLLAGFGGALGVAIAYFAAPVLSSFIAVPWLPVAFDVRPDARLLAAACVATGCAAILATLLPALRLSQVAPRWNMGSAGRTTGDRSSRGFGSALVVVQLAFSLALVVVVGFLLRTMSNLAAVDPGFRPDHVVELRVGHEIPRRPGVVPSAEDLNKVHTLYRSVEDRMQAIPGVRSASLSWLGLFGGSDQNLRFYDPANPEDKIMSRVDCVTPRYFDTVGMSIRRGRGIAASDREGAPRVAIVNEAFARARFGAGEPLGRQLIMEFRGASNLPMTIVGVISDSKYNDLREQTVKPMVWIPLFQATNFVSSVMLRVQPGMEREVAKQAEAALNRMDVNILVRNVRTLRDTVRETTVRERLILGIAGGFGALALLLAAIGVYGTLSFSVASRTREIGVRLALGADAAGVRNMVIGGALKLAAIALVLGVPLALAGGYALRSFLFGVEAYDAATLAGACAVLGVAAIVAAAIPARRASRIEPVTALRYD